MNKLRKPVLILNKNWIAFRIKDVMKAIKLVYRKRACFIDPIDYSVYTWEQWILLNLKDGEEFISTARYNIKIPEVIVLTKYNKVPEYDKTIRLNKKNIYIRDNGVCQYSGKKVSRDNSNVDHIVPRSRGGAHSWSNLVLCDKDVNTKKGDKTPQEAGLKLLSVPKKPKTRSIMLQSLEGKKYPSSWEKFVK